MDLQLTRRGDYAVRAAILLAQAASSGAFVKLREVSSTMDIPARYTQEILALLVRSGLAEARAGKQGGYRLIRAPDEITLLDVVEAAEGPLRLQRCTISGGQCHWEDRVCAVHSLWEEANVALTGVLKGQSLRAVAELDSRIRQLQAK